MEEMHAIYIKGKRGGMSVSSRFYVFLSWIIMTCQSYQVTEGISGILQPRASHLALPVLGIWGKIHTTHIIDRTYLFVHREQGLQVAQPGVGTPDSYKEEEMEEKWRFHNYYQWVVFFLFFQVGVLLCGNTCHSSIKAWSLWLGYAYIQ